MFLLTLGPVYFVRDHLGTIEVPWEDDGGVRLVFGTLGIASALGLIRLRPWGVRSSDPQIVALVGAVSVALLAPISALWSIGTTTTLWRGGLFLGTTAFGVWLAGRFDLATQARLWLAAMTLGVVASIVYVLVDEWSGKLYNGGYVEWVGIYYNRNSLGPVCGLGVLAALEVFRTTRGPWRLLPLVAGGACWWVLMGTVSRSAQLATLAGLLVGVLALFTADLLARHPRQTRRFAFLWMVLGATAAIAALSGWRRWVRVVGRYETLSGRAPLWRFVRQRITERPTLGHGFDAFWATPRSTSLAVQQLGWSPPTAHNGYLEMMLSLGVAGTMPMLVMVGAGVANSARLIRVRPERGWLWAPVSGIFALVTNVSESFTLPNQFLWALLVASCCAGWNQRSASA